MASHQVVFKDLNLAADFLFKYAKKNTIFLFNGEMSSGKTTLVSEILRKLKIRLVNSPTYALHYQYVGQDIMVQHLDLHRLTSDEDIESSGFWDILQAPESLFLIEWANKISTDHWPLNLHQISVDIKIDSFNERTYLISSNIF